MDQVGQIQSQQKSFIKALLLILKSRDIHFNDQESALAEINTLSVNREVFAQHGFEMAVTLTLIKAKQITSVLNISYDKANSEEMSWAYAAYQALIAATNRLGYCPDRYGIISEPQNARTS